MYIGIGTLVVIVIIVLVVLFLRRLPIRSGMTVISDFDERVGRAMRATTRADARGALLRARLGHAATRRLSSDALDLTRARATRTAGPRKRSRWLLFRRAGQTAGPALQG